MNKCKDCFYFKKVKLIKTEQGIEGIFGYCFKDKTQEVYEGNEPGCRDFLEEQEDPLYN